MKKSLVLSLAALAFVLACAFFVLVTAVSAAPVQLSPLAEIAAPAAPWYASDAFWTSLLAVIAGLVAILRNKSATTAQKINAALVLGIEQATQLPEVAAAETKVKNLIRSKAQQAGVEPILNRLVKDLTP